MHVSSALGTAAGTVTVSEGRTRLASATLHSGSATLTLPTRGVGRHTLTVSYSGDTAHAAASRTLVLTVARAASHTSLGLSVSSTHTATLTAHTTVVTPGRAPVTGTVTFYDNGHRFATVRTTGTARVHHTLGHGKHTLTARYSGSSLVSASSGTRHDTV